MARICECEECGAHYGRQEETWVDGQALHLCPDCAEEYLAPGSADEPDWADMAWGL